MESVIKIIGHGAVVRHFLHHSVQLFPHIIFEIYARNVEIEASGNDNVRFDTLERYYATEDDITFFCCSANEQEILQNPYREGRLKVAENNLAIASWFVTNGFFRRGALFVLTNPSEIIGEYFYRQTKNLHIFALGLSNDYRRYINIFSKMGISPQGISKFTLGGNHWDYPVPIFDDDPRLYQQLMTVFAANSSQTFDQLLDHLHTLLKQEIRAEFLGIKPPVKSGALVLHDAILAISSGTQVLVSSLEPQKENFVAGMLLCQGPNQLVFKSAQFKDSQAIVGEIYERHRLAFSELMRGF